MIFKWVDASRKRHCFTPKTILLFSLNENCNRNFKTLGQPMSKTKRHIPMRVFMCIIKVYVKSKLIELKLKMHTSGREGGRMRVRHKQIIEKYSINGVASECKTFQMATQNVAANGRFFMKYSHVIIPPHDRNRPNFVIATIYIDVHIIYLHFYKMFISNNFWLVSVLKSIRKQRVRAAHQSEEEWLNKNVRKSK